MLFKDLKTGCLVYILHKNSPMYVSQGKVVSNPTMHMNNLGQYNINQLQTAQMMVDVTIEDDGVTKTYTIPETSSLTYANDLVLATDRDNLLREVENLRALSLDHISKTEHHKKVVDECEHILAELNPAVKEKKETEARFGKIESDMFDVKTMIKDLISKLS